MSNTSTPLDRPPDQNDWESDSWKDDDAWARDDWKNKDWGKPAAKRIEPTGRRSKGGMDAYGAGMIEAGPHLSLGMQIAFGMALFVGIGYGIDQWLESTPWGMIVGAALGMVAVFALIVRMAREADEKLRAKRKTTQASDA